ncbi:hypothetical protein B1H20_16455 [Streptomyces violaceoruber]|uniref:Translation initiation factor 2 n=1 Tax=Streptomyces violaceoruber TaxID=1935 RepID=A0A1V0UC45_STRVN|nr:hypothetical protein [Streptomyces violaceoruber]ARF62804.1 hypothetical protein B1H20_16455 [Streptomyces violaceoruber]
MAPGRSAAWPARCAVGLLAAAGAAMGPLGGSAHGAPPPDGPSRTATAPVPASGPSGAATSAAPPGPASPRPGTTGSGSPAAFPAGLPQPSGVPSHGEPGEWPVPSSTASGGRGAPGDDAPGTSPSPSASPEVSGSTAPLAGREAGAGKARPGRSLSPYEPAAAETPLTREPYDEADESRVDPVDLPASTPPPDAFTDPAQRAAAQALDAASLRRVQQVSLGTGIALVGLGLGFLALRMRRVY